MHLLIIAINMYFYFWPVADTTSIYERELRYWDKQWAEMQKITPKGKEQRKNYNECKTFYFNKRNELLNKIEWRN